jgi:3-dehydroquinate synthetase
MDAYMDFIAHDKKVVNSDVFVLLCRGIGKVERVRVRLDSNLRKHIQEYIASYRILRKRALAV